MANNLRVFNSDSEYQSADLILPSVSYVVETDKVIYDYTPPTPPTPSFKWKATYQDSHTESAQCGSSSAIGMGEINLTNLVSVEIGNCAIELGEFSLAFSSIESITISDSVETLNNNSLMGCANLASVNIPSGVVYIGHQVFQGCRNLTSITVNAIHPPQLGGDVFVGSNCPIYVPSASVNAYKTATNWSSYADRIQAIP